MWPGRPCVTATTRRTKLVFLKDLVLTVDEKAGRKRSITSSPFEAAEFVCHRLPYKNYLFLRFK